MRYSFLKGTLFVFAIAQTIVSSAQTPKEVQELAEKYKRKAFGIEEAEKAGQAKVDEVHKRYSQDESGEALAASTKESSCGHALSSDEIEHLRLVHGWVEQLLANPTPDNINSVTQTMTKAARELSKGDPAAQSYLQQLQFREMLMIRNNKLNKITKKFADNPQLFNETDLNAITALTTDEKNLLVSIGKATGVENPLGMIQKMARDKKDSYRLLEQRGAKVLPDGAWDFSKIDMGVIAKGGPEKDALINAWAEFVPALKGNHVSFAAGQDPKIDATKKVADVIADPTRKGPLFLENSVILPHNPWVKGDFVPEVFTLEGYGQALADRMKHFENNLKAAQTALKKIDWANFAYNGPVAGSPATDEFQAAMKNVQILRTDLVNRFGWTRSMADEKALEASKNELRDASAVYYKGIYDNLKSKGRVTKEYDAWFRDNWDTYKSKAPRFKPPGTHSPLAEFDAHVAMLEAGFVAGLDKADHDLMTLMWTARLAPWVALGGAAWASRGAVAAGETLFSISSKSGSLYGSTSSIGGVLGVWGSYGKMYSAGLAIEAATLLGSSAVQSVSTGESFRCVAWDKFEKNAGAALALNSVFAALGPIGERVGVAAKAPGMLGGSARAGRFLFMGVGGTAMVLGAKGGYDSMNRALGDSKTADQYRAQGDFEMADAYQRAAGQHWGDVTSFVGAIGLSFVGLKGGLGKPSVSNAEAETHILKLFGKDLGGELASIVKNGYKNSAEPLVLKFTGREGHVASILERLPKQVLENAEQRAIVFKAIAAMEEDSLQFVRNLEGPQFLKSFKDARGRVAYQELKAINGGHAFAPEQLAKYKELKALMTSGKTLSIEESALLAELEHARQAATLSPERAAKILSSFDDDGLDGLNEVLSRANKMRAENVAMNRDEAVRKSIEALIRSRNVDPKHVITDDEMARMIACLD